MPDQELTAGRSRRLRPGRPAACLPLIAGLVLAGCTSSGEVPPARTAAPTLQAGFATSVAAAVASASAVAPPTALSTPAGPVPTALGPSGLPGGGPTADPNERTISGAAPAAPVIDESTVACGLDQRVLLSVRWTPGSPSAEQRLDLSQFANDFHPGTFASSEILPGQQASYEWPGLGAGVPFRIRVLRREGEGWLAGPTEIVASQRCPQGDSPG